MDFSVGRAERELALSVDEVTGAVGDSVTVLPVVVAVAALTDLGLPLLLLWFGAFQVIWGLWYGHPVSVEPMKALAALVIAGSLSVAELALAGTVAGGVLLALGAVGALGALADRIDEAVVRGVQLAVALVLARTGVELGVADPAVALGAVVVGVGVAALGHPRASALAVLALGVVLAGMETGTPSLAIPDLRVGVAFAPTADALSATGAQLAMTVGNAAVATSLLLSDLFDADVSPDELSASMGAMNLVAVPLGALPMCHGSGGVAGKYAFGARTAGSNLVLGVLYAGAALGAAGLVAAFPLAALGAVLVLVAVQLGRTSLRTESVGLTVGIGVLGLVTNVGLAFAAGIAASALFPRIRGAMA